ncbi:MAG: S1C family serine protease [bacterium]
MDIENLTKHQIVLLTLLVSFMTSIATGIVTVALMSHAPPVISRTINQIVEHTIQTVASSTQGTTVVQTQKTVVVKDDDLIAQSIAALQKSIIRITVKGGQDLVARGVFIDAKGVALTDRASLDATGVTAFDAILPSGERVPLVMRDPMGTSTLALVDVRVGTSTGLASAPLADRSKLRLGQTVLRIGGTGVDTVAVGVIATLPSSGTYAKTIDASVGSSVPGAILATLFGEVVGMTTSSSLDSGGSATYTFVSLPQVAAAPAVPAKPEPKP